MYITYKYTKYPRANIYNICKLFTYKVYIDT